MMINTHVKFESNRAVRTQVITWIRNWMCFFSIFNNSDLDFIPPKKQRGLPSMINTQVKFECKRAIRTWVITWIRNLMFFLFLVSATLSWTSYPQTWIRNLMQFFLSIFSNSDLDFDIIPPKGLPSMLFNIREIWMQSGYQNLTYHPETYLWDKVITIGYLHLSMQGPNNYLVGLWGCHYNYGNLCYQ